MARVFGDNMVLQRGPQTVLWGSGGTNHQPVWVQYRGATWQTNADITGDWRMVLDLNKPIFGQPATLKVGVGKKGKGPVLSFTNVAVGRVWLLTDWQKQSVRLEAVQKLTDAKSQIRFLDLSNPAREPRWGFYDTLVRALEANAFSLYLARTLAESGYAGIIQAAPQDLQASPEPAHAGNPLHEVACVQNAVLMANKAVGRYQATRYDQLVQAKHDGLVREIPPAFDYSLPLVYPPAAFACGRTPLGWLTFEAAIWPGAAPRQ